MFVSVEDSACARAHGPGRARGTRVAHHAPHVRPRAVADPARRAAGVAGQRALRTRRHEVRRSRADRIRHAEPKGLDLLRIFMSSAIALFRKVYVRDYVVGMLLVIQPYDVVAKYITVLHMYISIYLFCVL